MQFAKEANTMFQKFAANADYNGIKEADDFKASFPPRVKKMKTAYKEKALAKALDDVIYDIQTKVNGALSSFNKGPPKEWWEEGLYKMKQAKESFDKFTIREDFKKLRKAMEYKAEFIAIYEKFQVDYDTKTLGRAADDAIYDVNMKFNDAESTFKKGPPRVLVINLSFLLSRLGGMKPVTNYKLAKKCLPS
jgi:hypothetical protein